MRRQVLVVALILVSAYIAVAVSPLRSAFGRSNPALASLFSAPTFNFSETYESGHVLEFKIGMSRAEFVRALEANYPANAALLSKCGGDSGYRPQVITRHDRSIWNELLKRPTVCLSASRRLMLFFHFNGEELTRAKVAVVTMELI